MSSAFSWESAPNGAAQRALAAWKHLNQCHQNWNKKAFGPAGLAGLGGDAVHVMVGVIRRFRQVFGGQSVGQRTEIQPESFFTAAYHDVEVSCIGDSILDVGVVAINLHPQRIAPQTSALSGVRAVQSLLLLMCSKVASNTTHTDTRFTGHVIISGAVRESRVMIVSLRGLQGVNSAQRQRHGGRGSCCSDSQADISCVGRTGIMSVEALQGRSNIVRSPTERYFLWHSSIQVSQAECGEVLEHVTALVGLVDSSVAAVEAQQRRICLPVLSVLGCGPVDVLGLVSCMAVLRVLSAAQPANLADAVFGSSLMCACSEGSFLPTVCACQVSCIRCTALACCSEGSLTPCAHVLLRGLTSIGSDVRGCATAAPHAVPDAGADPRTVRASSESGLQIWELRWLCEGKVLLLQRGPAVAPTSAPAAVAASLAHSSTT
eukprot:6482250-Amphidinium_carterae.2